MAKLVAENSVCYKCQSIVKLPGRKCAACNEFFCNQCLDDVEMKDCLRCRYGWTNKISELDTILVKGLRFYCKREECSERHHGFSYREFEDHCDEHLVQDSAKWYISKNQPQYFHVYNGIRKFSLLSSLKKLVDVKKKMSVAKHVEQKVYEIEDLRMV